MLKITKKTKKIFSILAIYALLSMEILPSVANAADIVIPESVLNLIGDNSASTTPVNSATNDPMGESNKQPGPKVEVTFNSSGGTQSGSHMTATAITSYFNTNDPKKLYFTWYLKRSSCELTNSDDPTGKQGKIETDSNKIAKCDFDGDKIITVNDWKIAAAKVIVDGSFDSNATDSNGNKVVKYDAGSYLHEIDSGYKAMPSPLGEWSINSGASENDKNAPNCYVQSPESGTIYELRKTIPDFDQICPSGYHRACITDQVAKCDVLNPLYTQSALDFATTNNTTPPLKTISNDFGACAVSSEKSDNSDVICSIKDDTALRNFDATVKCTNGDETMCVKDSGYTNFPSDATDPVATTNPLIGVIFGKNIIGDDLNKDTICKSLAKPNNGVGIFIKPPNFLDNTQPAISAENEKCVVVKDELINGKKDIKGNVVISGKSELNPAKCGFKKDVNLCKHLFPIVPRGVTGDGKFTLDEKKFWGADPNQVSTNGTGNDEQNVVGMGQDKFTWIFSPGDQVGLAVEGDSILPSDHAVDSSYKRMWAFSKGSCEALGDIEKNSTIDPSEPNENKRGFYFEGTDTSKLGFKTAEVDLDNCLEENLLDPDDSGNSKLSVQLNASPQNPINDPNGRGDILNIDSSAANTKNQDGLLYKWSVQKSRDGSTAPIDTTSWIDITKLMEKGGSFSESDIAGLDKKRLAINLNMQESDIQNGLNNDSYHGVFYLKIKVKITGTAADGSQNASGEAIVRVRQQQNEMSVYPVSASDSGMLNLKKGLTNNSFELCRDQWSKSTCYVTQNEILGLEVPEIGENRLSNFSWTVNGNSMTCNTSISSECVPGGNKLFFPILGNVGEAINVVAKAINSKNESIEVSRHFVIIEPQVQIYSLDSSSAWPKLLGYYKDINGNRYPDYSTSVMETFSGSTMILGAAFYPAWKGGQAGFDWSIDGQVDKTLSNKNEIQLPVSKFVGDNYDIGLVANYNPGADDQLNNLRKALLKNWGISPDDTIETNNGASMQINVVDMPTVAKTDANQNGITASLITHLPEQLFFLLKITLTSTALLLFMGLIFAIMPETLVEKEN